MFAYLHAEEQVYSHAWRNGDIIIWDNLAIQHARGEIRGGTRTLQRVTIAEYGYWDQYPVDMPTYEALQEVKHRATPQPPSQSNNWPGDTVSGNRVLEGKTALVAGGTLPCSGLGADCAAKAALEMFVKVAADEVSKAQIRINAVRPGFTRAEGTEAMFADETLLKTFTDFIPTGRAGEPEDLARAIRFLAGPESGWVTGQIFAADGGQELRGFPDPNYSLDLIDGKAVMNGVRSGRPPE